MFTVREEVVEAAPRGELLLPSSGLRRRWLMERSEEEARGKTCRGLSAEMAAAAGRRAEQISSNIPFLRSKIFPILAA